MSTFDTIFTPITATGGYQMVPLGGGCAPLSTLAPPPRNATAAVLMGLDGEAFAFRMDAAAISGANVKILVWRGATPLLLTSREQINAIRIRKVGGFFNLCIQYFTGHSGSIR